MKVIEKEILVFEYSFCIIKRKPHNSSKNSYRHDNKLENISFTFLEK